MSTDPIHCPSCGSGSRIKDGSFAAAGFKRRRECLSCEAKWNTYELVLADLVDLQRALDKCAKSASEAAQRAIAFLADLRENSQGGLKRPEVGLDVPNKQVKQ